MLLCKEKKKICIKQKKTQERKNPRQHQIFGWNKSKNQMIYYYYYYRNQKHIVNIREKKNGEEKKQEQNSRISEKKEK